MKCAILAWALCLIAIPIGASPAFAEASPENAVPQSTPIAHGRISHHTYQTAIGRNHPSGVEDYYVYTPPGYDPHGVPAYPVLYLCHGYKEMAITWQTQGHVTRILDELIADGTVRPMIVVMPSAYGDYKFRSDGYRVWLSAQRIDENTALFSQMLTHEIMPQVESSYSISKKREDRAIAGYSMGGREAIFIGVENARKFAWVGSFSGAFPIINTVHITSTTPEKAKFKLLWLSFGISDVWTRKGNMNFIAYLNDQGWKPTTVPMRGTHFWPVWQNELEQFLPLLFQKN